MEAGGYENEHYWQGELARRWLRGEDVSGGQFTAWMEIWKYLQEHPDWNDQFEQSGNYSPSEIESYEYVAGLSEEELKEQLSRQLTKKSRSQPAYWKERERNNLSQPVVGITWFEARAYCAWLSEVTGRAFRLPTEVEWESAARGSLTPVPSTSRGEGRKYPWGSEWDQDKANSIEGRVLKPSFGTVRYMSSENTARKLRVKDYVRRDTTDR